MAHNSFPFMACSTSLATSIRKRVRAQAINCASVSFEFSMTQLSDFFALQGYTTGFTS